MKSTKRFVIQKHTRAEEIHWDLMLESGQVLQTYRLDLSPAELLQGPTDAIRIFDHSLKFLTYEGSVNKGRDSVEIADTGTYQLLNEDSEKQELQFDGKVLKGKFTLTHIEDDRWHFAPTTPPLSFLRKQESIS